jgi:hypothetical protein
MAFRSWAAVVTIQAALQALGPGRHAFGQMHAIGLDSGRKRWVRSYEQYPMPLGAEPFEGQSGFKPGFCAKMPKNDPQTAVQAARKALQRRHGVHDAAGIGQKQQSRQGFAFTFPAVSGF